MRYKLRTPLIVLALGPPVLAGAWLVFNELRTRASATVEWDTELSLIHGTGQTVESHDEAEGAPAN